MTKSPDPAMNFSTFFQTVYREDHQHPANVALHMVGVFLGIALVAASITVWPWWTLGGFPVVHAMPGLLGHRLFDRNAAVGDVRVTRTDHPLWWFIIANHLMTARVLSFRW